MYKQNYYLDYHPCLLRYTVEFKILFADPQFRDPRSKDQFKREGEEKEKKWSRKKFKALNKHLSLKFLLDYNVTRQNVQRSLHSSMFLLEYQESARIRRNACVREKDVYTHTRAGIRIEDSLLSGQRSPESLFPRDLSTSPPSPIPFSPAVYFHGKRHGNPWERQWKRNS